MYIIQENQKHDTWLDITKSSDYDYIIELYNLYCEKYENKVFRVIEVFIYV